MDAGIRVVLIKAEEPRDQGIALAGGEGFRLVSAEGQDQRSAGRIVGVEEDDVRGWSPLTMKLRSLGSELCRRSGQTSPPQPNR